MIHFKCQKSSHSHFRMHARMLISLIGFLVASSLLISCGSAATVQATPKLVATPTSTPQPPTPTSQPPTPTPTTATATPQPPTPTPTPQAEPAVLDLQPATMSIVGHLDCQRTTVYVCQARVLSRSSNQSNLHWTDYTNVPGQIVFNPAGGVLASGKSVIVMISVPFTSCTPGLFFFRGPINTHTITWAC